MLSPNYLDDMTDDILEIYGEYESYILQDIAKRIAKAGNKGITSTAEWQIVIAQEAGILYDDLIQKVSELNNVSIKELTAVFEDAGIKALKFDDSIYREAGLNPLPIKQSPAMLQILVAGVKKNYDALRNITMTTAATSRDLLIRTADIAYMQIATGAFDYQSAIANAVKQMVNEGVTTIAYDSGRKINVMSAVRRTVMTGVNQTAGQMQIGRAGEMGSDLVETTAHIGSRPEHAVWQGKIFSLSGEYKKYPSFYASTGYGTPSGLCGVNCRHSFFPFFYGLSEHAYSKTQLESMNSKEVAYTDPGGKKNVMTYYEATQKLRAIEGNIRKWKLEADCLKSAGVDDSFARGKTRAWQAVAKDFTEQTGVKRDYFREKVMKPDGVPTPPKPATAPKKKPRAVEFEDIDTFVKNNLGLMPNNIHGYSMDKYLEFLKPGYDEEKLASMAYDVVPLAQLDKMKSAIKVQLKGLGMEGDSTLYQEKLIEEKAKEVRRSFAKEVKRNIRVERVPEEFKLTYNVGEGADPQFLQSKLEDFYFKMREQYESDPYALRSKIIESRQDGGGNCGEDSIMQIMFEDILKKESRDALPKKVSLDEFYELKDAGEINVYRGFGSKVERQVEFKEGKLYYGKGIYGNGTYTAGDYGDALDYARGKNANVHEFVLSPDAKIISHDDLTNFAYAVKKDLKNSTDEIEEMAESFGITPEDFDAKMASEVIGEDGRLAIMMGYDAIHVAHSDYYIILNRGKLIYADKEEYEAHIA